MSDFKSKLPDFKELSSMTGKLLKGIKASVEEIIHDYKEKRAETTPAEEAKKETKPVKKESSEKVKKTEDAKE